MKLQLSLPTLSIPTLAALLFGAFTALAAASLHLVLSRFALEAQIDEWILIVSPALLSMVIALIVYRRAGDRIRKIGQSLSRGLVVGVLTWIGFAALSTWMWCIPTLYAECLRHTLMISGALGGGQLLVGALCAAAITGRVIGSRAARIEADKG